MCDEFAAESRSYQAYTQLKREILQIVPGKNLVVITE